MAACLGYADRAKTVHGHMDTAKTRSPATCLRGKNMRRPVLASSKGIVPSLVARCVAMAARTEEQLRRRAETERRRYRTKRLASLKKRLPGMLPDVLERATSRQVSIALRRLGDGQSTLSSFSQVECSSGSISNMPSFGPEA